MATQQANRKWSAKVTDGLTPVSWRDESLGSGSLALRHVILGFLAFFGSAPGGALLPSRPVH